MTLPVSKGFILVVCVALVAAGIVLWSSNGSDAADDDGLARTVRPEKSAAPATVESIAPQPGDLGARIEQLASRAPRTDVGDLFGASGPPPPPPRDTGKAPKPTAPPFPYTYMGALQDGATRTIFLTSADDRVITARADQIIDGLYRVESIDAKTLTVSYLPLHQQQSIGLDHSR